VKLLWLTLTRSRSSTSTRTWHSRRHCAWLSPEHSFPVTKEMKRLRPQQSFWPTCLSPANASHSWIAVRRSNSRPDGMAGHRAGECRARDSASKATTSGHQSSIVRQQPAIVTRSRKGPRDSAKPQKAQRVVSCSQGGGGSGSLQIGLGGHLRGSAALSRVREDDMSGSATRSPRLR
jgi:hypothetical protein